MAYEPFAYSSPIPLLPFLYSPPLSSPSSSQPSIYSPPISPQFLSISFAVHVINVLGLYLT